MRKLIFGCGYLGTRVAKRWQADGHEVFAVTRSLPRAEEFQQQGWKPIIADLTDPASLQNLPAVDVVLFAVGFDRTQAAHQTIHQVYVDGLRNVLASLRNSVKRFIYISSTGVFGKSSGDWVNEDSSCEPLREGGEACLAAEKLLNDSTLRDRAVILRLAGIYGPGRIPMRQLLAAGKPIPVPSEGYLNLIHVDDAAAIVCLAEAATTASSLFLVSDGHPVVRAEYYRHLANLIEASPPQFETPPPSSPAAARAASDKRISNARLVQELAPQFAFPSYREGLAAIVKGEPPTGPSAS